MKKFFKILSIFLLVIAAIAGAVYAYFYFVKAGDRKIFSAIPDDAIYIIETEDLTEGWEKISNNKIWNYAKKNEYFSDINASASTLDSLIKENASVKKLLANRHLTVSAHMISNNDYDFLFAVDIEKASKITFLKDWISGLLGLFDYSMIKQNYNGYELLVLTNKIDHENIYFSFVENIMICSFNESIAKKSLDHFKSNQWEKNVSFIKVSSSLKSGKLFNFYFNYQQLSAFLKCYLAEDSDLVASLANSLMYSAFNINIEDDEFEFDGFTNLNDSTSSYLKALSKVKPSKMNAYSVISEDAALYLAMCFDNFDDFYQNMISEFGTQDSVNKSSYDKNLRKIERFLNINLQDDFFSWIGSEISFVKLRPQSTKSGENDVLVLFQTDNPEQAQAGLDHLLKQIRKRTPAKFKTAFYQDYPINYLDIKGFFKLFLGKLFGQLEKPYYTIIDNYVVFSNAPSTLMRFIDHYKSGKTIGNNQVMANILSKYKGETNVTALINMPKMYSHLYFYSKDSTRMQVQKNKELILSLSTIGFQLLNKNEQFSTKLTVLFNENAYNDNEVEKFDTAPEELIYSSISAAQIKVGLENISLQNEGLMVLKNDSGLTFAEGNVSNGKPEGKWLFYYDSGNIKSNINFKDGLVDGSALFYFDNTGQKVQAEVNFKDDFIDGQYIEYYDNSVLRAKIEFKEGKLDGKAQFYYPNGKTLMLGSYKDNEKDGKWKCFTELGNVFDKEKWRKGNQK